MKKKEHHHQHIYDLCKKHMHAYVLVEMVDGSQVDGIITGLDQENVYLAVPIQSHTPPMQGPSYPKQSREYSSYSGGWGGPSYGGGWGGPPYYGGYGGYGGGPYGPYASPFERLVIPLAALATLSLLPWY